MRSVRADIRDPSVHDGDIGIWNEFPGLHTDPGAFAENQIGRLTPHGNIDQVSGGLV